MSAAADLRFRQAPGVLSRSFAGEVILAPTDREELESLSETAGAVWRLLAEPRPLDGVLAALEGAYGCPGAEIAGEVEALLSDLVDRGLVERIRPDDG